MRSRVLILCSSVAMAASMSFALTQHTQTATTKKPETTQQRKQDQQNRIAQGIKSGMITPGGAAKQEGREQGLNRQISSERQANGGKLTAAQRQNVNQQQNKQLQQIHNEKHNAKTGY